MISTVVSSASAPYTRVSPITFNITFGSAISDVTFTSDELNITNGSLIRMTGTGANWQAIVSPTAQDVVVSLSVPAGVAANGLPDINSASNVLGVGFNSMKCRVVIEHELNPITNANYMPISVVFERDVTGFTAADLELTNCSVKSISGSGSVYTVMLLPQKIGQVSFYVKAGGATDVYGNTNSKSNEVVLEFDPTAIDEKSDALYGEVQDPDVLIDFSLDELNQVAAINTLADCAKNIPQRLLEMATEKAFAILSKNPTVQKLAGAVAIAQASIETIQTITENVQAIVENPETLMAALLEAQGLTGEALRQKMQYIADTFGNVSGLNTLIATAMATGVCGMPDYYADGTAVPKQTLTPTDVMPPSVPGVAAGAVVTYDSGPKDAYDEFTFTLKEQLEIGDVADQDPDRACMISVVTTLAMGYHDNLSKTLDSSSDAALFEKYRANVELERQNNLGWSTDIKASYTTRTDLLGAHINRNAQVIRNFYNRNSMPTGTPISVGVTTYSGPDKDFTTFLDIKPSQRPPELTAYWASKYNIASQETKLEARGIKTGTLNYSDAYRGAYGQLISDKTVASSRFPGGSVIALRNPDGTPYNPSGKNPSGQFTVTDTGNAKLTFAKPDIFTSTPELYTNTGSVQVFLISKGSQTGKQYKLAQQKYA
jgi:hypothetical protein